MDDLLFGLKRIILSTENYVLISFQ